MKKNQFIAEKENALENARGAQHPETALSDNWIQTLMEDQLARGYLNRMEPAENWNMPESEFSQRFGWQKFIRLPIRPDESDDGQLMECWQSVLSALHTLDTKIAFVLLRARGKTNVYVGACARNGKTDYAAKVLKQSLTIHMPGAELEEPDGWETPEFLLSKLSEASGVVTGIPSLRGANAFRLQTLSKLSRGISVQGNEKDYALVVIADPAQDEEITRLQETLLNLKSEIHYLTSYNESVSLSDSFTKGKSSGHHLNAGAGGGMVEGAEGAMISLPTVGGLVRSAVAIASQVAGAASPTANVIRLLGGVIGGYSKSWNSQESRTQSTSTSISREKRDYAAQYAESMIDRHVSRLEGGRSLGFWQTGVYVLSDERETVDSVLALIRSVYSGSESHTEPIRVFNTTDQPLVGQYIRDFRLLPLPVSENDFREKAEETWHVFGRMHESFTTAMTTKELSIATSLPRRDVPGLRFVKNAVHFAANPHKNTESAVTLGNIVDMGAIQQTPYTIDIHSLVRHALISGGTGSGKSTTCKRILTEALKKDIPVLIIEPAKDDYVRWALKMNETLPEEKKFRVFMPGAAEIEGMPVLSLHINPFEPAAWQDSCISLMQRCENFATLLNACLPSEDVIPILIDEAVHYCMRVKSANAGIDIDEFENPQMEKYPTMVSLKCAGNTVISKKTYATQTKDSFEEILRTRFTYLARGLRGSVLNCDKSVSYDDLFSRPTVINLSKFSGTRDKSLIMSLLLLSLYEYRISRYNNDKAYREEAGKNRLMHLMLIEEAHNVLMKPSPMAHGNSPEQAAADLFTNMLSEIRSYGQGVMIADQVPTRLIDDAIKNTNYKIAHRMTAPDDCAVMASAMSLRTEQAAILTSLEIGQAVICGDMDDAAAWVKVKRA